MARGVVKHVTVQLTQADDYLERVTERVLLDDAPGTDEGEGTPEEGRDGLHTDDEGILGQVARVGEGILLPELAK